jgi:hypothetical protein
VPVILSSMSSTELASQEQQESIKQAEQDALEHSILTKTTVPRAKITHKGLQDIEDVNEDSAVAKQRERELEMADQERERERERLARLRTVQLQTQPHSNPPSASVPPESPVVPNSAGGAASAPWGPPPPPVQPVQASDFAHAVDPELNLGDFIHMDDEPPESGHAPSVTPDVSMPSESSMVGQGQRQQQQPQQEKGQSTTPITGISPFAPNQPDMPPRASFDLNALWSAPQPQPPPEPQQEGSSESGGASAEGNEGGDAMDLGTPPNEEDRLGGADEPTSVTEPEQGVEGDDLDFAMFLGQEEEKEKEKGLIEESSSQPDPQIVFQSLPRVWNGIVSFRF